MSALRGWSWKCLPRRKKTRAYWDNSLDADSKDPMKQYTVQAELGFDNGSNPSTPQSKYEPQDIANPVQNTGTTTDQPSCLSASSDEQKDIASHRPQKGASKKSQQREGDKLRVTFSETGIERTRSPTAKSLGPPTSSPTPPAQAGDRIAQSSDSDSAGRSRPAPATPSAKDDSASPRGPRHPADTAAAAAAAAAADPGAASTTPPPAGVSTPGAVVSDARNASPGAESEQGRPSPAAAHTATDLHNRPPEAEDPSPARGSIGKEAAHRPRGASPSLTAQFVRVLPGAGSPGTGSRASPPRRPGQRGASRQPRGPPHRPGGG